MATGERDRQLDLAQVVDPDRPVMALLGQEHLDEVAATVSSCSAGAGFRVNRSTGRYLTCGALPSAT
jgi:hypothetical protein